MKNFLSLAIVFSLVTFTFIACSKDVKEEQRDEVSPEVLAQIKALGFDTREAKKVEEGYLVENDIILTPEQLNAVHPSSPEMIIANEEHYRTFNLVSSGYTTITVRLYNTSANHQSAFSLALDNAIARYNALGLRFRMQRVTSGGNIVINSYYEVSNVLGSAGFPSNSGAPYGSIKMNTYHYSTSTSTTNTNYIATIMAHEMGHCVGFRHTDYMNRAYSCGSGGNEGQTTTGVGAVHIPGTPTGPSSGSWMLACIGSGVNRPFTTYDKTALTYVY
jgi:hypothetical protein